MLKCEILSVIFFIKIILLLIKSGFKKEIMVYRKMLLILLFKELYVCKFR